MEQKTVGTVLSVKRQWWLKVNTKPIRIHPLDGATFPHIVKVKYAVGECEFVRRKWVGAGLPCPKVGDQIAVSYRVENPTKFRLEIADLEM